MFREQNCLFITAMVMFGYLSGFQNLKLSSWLCQYALYIVDFTKSKIKLSTSSAVSECFLFCSRKTFARILIRPNCFQHESLIKVRWIRRFSIALTLCQVGRIPRKYFPGIFLIEDFY